MDKRKLSNCISIITLDLLRLLIVFVIVFILGVHTTIITNDYSFAANSSTIKVQLLASDSAALTPSVK